MYTPHHHLQMCWTNTLTLVTGMWLLLACHSEGTPTSTSAATAAAAYSYNIGRNDEICGPQNGRKTYLELGERGVLRASNVSARTPAPGTTTLVSSHSQCSFEVVTCPSCVIALTFRHINLSTCSQEQNCRCDYVWVTEPPYESSGTPFCGVVAEGSASSPSYRSQTRIVNIALLFSGSHRDAFVLEYHAERNRQVFGLLPSLSGLFPKSVSEYNSSGSAGGSRGGVLSSPFFPSSYPRDLGAEYVITSMDQRARVHILFSDFQLATSSIMEFYDWNGQRIDVTSGTSFRPAAIVSTGPSLLIRFYANGGAGLGYRATYAFTADSNKDPNLRPITDCGGFVENPGGAITMMHMAEEGLKHFDCIWIVKPPRNYFHLKTHLYLKIAQFSDFGGNTELVVRQGTTSHGVALDTLRSPVSEVLGAATRGQKELVIPVDVGFYIALRGAFGPRSKLAIVYAAFSYMDCFAGADLLCKNHRCISSRLMCDGFDHCGDNSDEPASTCFQDWSESSAMDRKWHSNTPNYFFPKMERYPDLKTATLVFLVSSLGLILLIVALIVLLYRMGARARQQRELQNRLQTISELLDGARIEDITPDEPPTYEAPPDYEEVIKVGSGQSPAAPSGTTVATEGPSAGPSMAGGRGLGKRRAKGKGPKQERRRAKSSPGVYVNAVSSSSREVSLRVALPLSPPTAHRAPAWPEAQGGSAPILLLARPHSPSIPVPDSPPPPYGTDLHLSASFSQDSLMAASTSLSAVERQINCLQQQNGETVATRIFEDSFASVINNPENNNEISITNIQTLTSPNIRTDNNSITHDVGGISPSDQILSNNNFSTTLSSSTTQDELTQFQNKFCKLASVEQFDDIGLSFDSVQVNNLIINPIDDVIPSTSTYNESTVQITETENFANFDEIGHYPSCESSKIINNSSVQSLNRSESSPNCLIQYDSQNNSTDLNNKPRHQYTQQELLTRSEPRSRSYEMLQSPSTSSNLSHVHRQNSEPQFNENSKLLQQQQQNKSSCSTDNANSNFDLQIELLKAQILKQNTKLIALQKFKSNNKTGSIEEGEVERRAHNISESEWSRISVSDSIAFESIPCSDNCSEFSSETVTFANVF